MTKGDAISITLVVDTSALIAIALGEPKASACVSAVKLADSVMISAGTLTEALIVASGKQKLPAMQALLAGMALDVIPVTAPFAELTAAAYRHYGKGFHPASLNFGDCFAYALAKEQDCPLLFVGNDFAQTDIGSAL